MNHPYPNDVDEGIEHDRGPARTHHATLARAFGWSLFFSVAILLVNAEAPRAEEYEAPANRAASAILPAQLIKDPVDTVSAIPKGVFRIFQNVGAGSTNIETISINELGEITLGEQR